jgi:hypothetical protein
MVETDCVAGHVRFELRNVGANYPFERSHGFAGIKPNSGQGDHSRLSCSAGISSSGLGSAGVFSSVLHRRWPSCGVAEKARIGRDLFRSEDDPPAAKASNAIAQFALDFPRKESVCGDHGRRA